MVTHGNRLGLLLLAFMLVTPLPIKADETTVRLATATSTENSGLLQRLLPPFERRTGYRVHVIAVGTGKALRLARDGNVDVVLAHAYEDELKFVTDGYGVNRRDVMYNDFVIVGPPGDPAGIRDLQDVADALRRIAASQSSFLSRGDNSGTHKKERALWQAAGVTPSGSWYREVGQGQGRTLQMASELQAYVLTDRGTWIAHRRIMPILLEGDARLYNRYGVIAVNPARHVDVNYMGAMRLIGWLTGVRGQAIILDYRIAGESLFLPLAVEPEGAVDNLIDASREALLLLVSGDPSLWTVVGISFSVSLKAILLAVPFALVIAFLLAHARFPGRRALITLFQTLLAFPAVVVGLTLYLLLSRSGPFGDLRLLFTQTAMVIGQMVLCFPILVAMGHAAIQAADRRAWETAITLGARPARAMLTLMHEVRFGLMAAVIAGFGRIIAEVGCSLMVGGNILNHTRNITTAIALETTRGQFAEGIALGLVLLVLALLLNFALMLLQGRGVMHA